MIRRGLTILSITALVLVLGPAPGVTHSQPTRVETVTVPLEPAPEPVVEMEPEPAEPPVNVVYVAPPPSVDTELRTFNSHYYKIRTNLTREEVLPFGIHMDAVFEQYQSRFTGFRPRRTGHMPLYLFCTQDDYVQFMASYNIDASNSGGMFFVNPGIQGLATWTQGHSRSQTFTTLQHEGFHQFAWNFIGQNLPIWINEGIAQYFEDAIIVGKTMKVGLANAERIELVRNAIREDRTLDIAQLIGVTEQQWNHTLRHDPKNASLLYAQSWSIVYFLVHGEHGQYLSSFEHYLRLVSRGRDSGDAFREAFGIDDLRPIGRRWRRFALTHKPDPINTTAQRMEFLGVALRFMMERDEPMPATLDELKDNLQARNFRVTRESHGLATETFATDEQNYIFPRGNGLTGTFQLLAPARDDLPPRILAAGLKPEPTLVWTRDDNDELVQDIRYR